MSSYATMSLLGDVGPQGRSEFVLTNKLVIPFDPFVVANARGAVEAPKSTEAQIMLRAPELWRLLS